MRPLQYDRSGLPQRAMLFVPASLWRIVTAELRAQCAFDLAIPLRNIADRSDLMWPKSNRLSKKRRGVSAERRNKKRIAVAEKADRTAYMILVRLSFHNSNRMFLCLLHSVCLTVYYFLVECSLMHLVYDFHNKYIWMTAKMPGEVNRKCRPRNTTVQPSTSYADPELHNAQRYRQTDRRTDDSIWCQ